MKATTLAPGAVRPDGLPHVIATGGCSAWSLPPDETSPGAARSVVRRVLTAMALPDDFAADAVQCVSEPSTNAITHAPGAQGRSAPPVAPELWVYRRGQEGRPQLVVAVFDALRRWRRRGTAERDDLFAEGGRGLDIVSTGRPRHRPGDPFWRHPPVAVSVRHGPAVWCRAGALCGSAGTGTQGDVQPHEQTAAAAGTPPRRMAA